MTPQSFDIDSLLRFNPPQYMCKKCYALLTNLSVNFTRKWESKVTCPICGIQYCSTQRDPLSIYNSYLFNNGQKLQFNDLIGHSRKLASIAQRARDSLKPQTNGRSPGPSYPPMRALLDALINAEKFAHFTTYGISDMILGALKLTAQRVVVRGIISDADERLVGELTNYRTEAPDMYTIVYERGSWSGGLSPSPHQKIVVVDGLLAFKGSANLTLSGLRKAAQGRDTFEIVTDVKEVVDLHNRFFSPIWAEHSTLEQINMDEFLPF
jgi:phosphatidylserine/phosphatidylglycerophosphate/cardiolipin synthase-like enzyme